MVLEDHQRIRHRLAWGRSAFAYTTGNTLVDDGVAIEELKLPFASSQSQSVALSNAVENSAGGQRHGSLSLETQIVLRHCKTSTSQQGREPGSIPASSFTSWSVAHRPCLDSAPGP
jgi:hypothetical protein